MRTIRNSAGAATQPCTAEPDRLSPLNPVKKRLMVGMTVFITVILDLVTKHIAAKSIQPYSPVELTSFFNLVNVQNTGAAFGIFSSLGNLFFIGISLLAIGFIFYLLLSTKESPFALALILGGAFGNLYDRVTLGYVRDFLDVHLGVKHWPAFNVADSALTVGITILFIAAFFHKPDQNTPTP